MQQTRDKTNKSRPLEISHEERSRLLFELNPLPCLMLDLESQRVVLANASAAQLYFYSNEELIGLNPEQLFGEGQYPFFARRLSSATKSSKIDGVWQHRTKKGDIVSVEITVIPFQKQNRSFVFMEIYDVSDWMGLQAALDEAELNHSRIFENAVEGIYQSTREDKFLTVNPAFARILGYDNPEEMISSIESISKQLYVSPSARENILKILDREGEALDLHFEAYRKDKSRVWLSTDARAVRSSEGQTVYYEGFIKDITSEKATKENLERFASQIKELIDGLLGRPKII